MAELSVNNVNGNKDLHVAEAATTTPPPTTASHVAAPGSTSGYDGTVRGGRPLTVKPLQLKTPGINGISRPACSDYLNPWCTG